VPIINKPLGFDFVDVGTRTELELVNATDEALNSVEVLTVFLKDETLDGGPSQAHIRFETLKSMQPHEKSILPHRTWVNGKPVDTSSDQLGRLKVVAGATRPYVLDISWQDAEGKTRFQRIPVGH
jgi:hypothetical protein